MEGVKSVVEMHQIVKGWAVILIAAGAAWWYYTGRYNKNRRRTSRPQPASQPPTPRMAADRDTSRAKIRADKSPAGGRDDTFSSDASNAKSTAKRKEKQKLPKSPSQRMTSASPAPRSGADDDGEDSNNKEFAQMMANARKGTDLATAARGNVRQRTIRQAAVDGNAGQSGASSTTGAEADDDMSPGVSPTLHARQDVTDMLEAPEPGPSVLRLTESNTSLSRPQKKSQQAASQQEQESKKQRQRRQRKETERTQREADEQERRRLMEQQMRTAREARGEPAKNGIPMPPTSNPWQTTGSKEPTWTKSAAAVVHPSAPADAPLLDTFEHSGGPSSLADSGSWETGLPSEEEQMNKLKELEEENSWNMVTSKKNKKKTAANSISSSGDTSPAEPVAPPMKSSGVNGINGVPKKAAPPANPEDAAWTVQGNASDSAWTA